MAGSEPIVDVLMTIGLPEAMVDELREISPRLRITNVPARRVEDIPADIWARSEVLYTDRVVPSPALVPLLHWVQFHFSGIDFAADSALLKQPNLMATTLSGAVSPQVAEYAVLMMLALGHKLADVFAIQPKAEWPRDRWERFSPFELRGSTVGLVGYGSIGREIARLIQPFGVKVLALKRDAMQPEDSGYTIPGQGDPGGDLFTRLYPFQAVKAMLKECDFIVVTLPLTPETRNLIGEEELRSCKLGAYLIHAGRGGVVNQEALASALQEKRLAGAAIDVFNEEPLPASSPFWKLPNAIVTPHIAGISPRYAERAMGLFRENLQRYLDGTPLLNRFDMLRGY